MNKYEKDMTEKIRNAYGSGMERWVAYCREIGFEIPESNIQKRTKEIGFWGHKLTLTLTPYFISMDGTLAYGEVGIMIDRQDGLSKDKIHQILFDEVCPPKTRDVTADFVVEKINAVDEVIREFVSWIDDMPVKEKPVEDYGNMNELAVKGSLAIK